MTVQVRGSQMHIAWSSTGSLCVLVKLLEHKGISKIEQGLSQGGASTLNGPKVSKMVPNLVYCFAQSVQNGP